MREKKYNELFFMFFHLSPHYGLLFSQIEHEYFSTTSFFLWNGLGKREKMPEGSWKNPQAND